MMTKISKHYIYYFLLTPMSLLGNDFLWYHICVTVTEAQ